MDDLGNAHGYLVVQAQMRSCMLFKRAVKLKRPGCSGSLRKVEGSHLIFVGDKTKKQHKIGLAISFCDLFIRFLDHLGTGMLTCWLAYLDESYGLVSHMYRSHTGM